MLNLYELPDTLLFEDRVDEDDLFDYRRADDFIILVGRSAGMLSLIVTSLLHSVSTLGLLILIFTEFS